MRASEVPNEVLMSYFESDILPQVPVKLREFDAKLAQSDYPPRKYYLHGSFARGTPSLHSDVDIAVVVDSAENISAKDFYDKLEERGTLCRIHGARIELTLYDRSFLESGNFQEGIKEINISETKDQTT